MKEYGRARPPAMTNGQPRCERCLQAEANYSIQGSAMICVRCLGDGDTIGGFIGVVGHPGVQGVQGIP